LDAKEMISDAALSRSARLLISKCICQKYAKEIIW
jgi:hypothetical protein